VARFPGPCVPPVVGVCSLPVSRTASIGRTDRGGRSVPVYQSPSVDVPRKMKRRQETNLLTAPAAFR
jgi:hypothetical protein